MGLDAAARGDLEKIIDDVIADIPQMVIEIRDIKSDWQIKEENDFVFGAAWATIIERFATSYSIAYQEILDDEERKEEVKVILNRIREIKEALFQAG